jgi:hypothetical protein
LDCSKLIAIVDGLHLSQLLIMSAVGLALGELCAREGFGLICSVSIHSSIVVGFNVGAHLAEVD